MKYIKTFEVKRSKFNMLKEEDEPIELVGYPEGNIIMVTEDELEELKNAINPTTEEEFDVRWDSEVDYGEGSWGQMRFMNDEEEEIEDWLKFYRKDPELYKNVKNYNL